MDWPKGLDRTHATPLADFRVQTSVLDSVRLDVKESGPLLGTPAIGQTRIAAVASARRVLQELHGPAVRAHARDEEPGATIEPARRGAPRLHQREHDQDGESGHKPIAFNSWDSNGP